MELKCLLGHDFGQREVERERREEGDEVVVVYRTVEACDRCGTRRVLSENTEVRSIRSAAPDRDDRPSGADGGDGTDGIATTDRTDAGPNADRSAPERVVEAAEAGGPPDAGTDAGTDAGADAPTPDDAVILSGADGTNDSGDGAADSTDETGSVADDPGDPRGDVERSTAGNRAADATVRPGGDPDDGTPTGGDRPDGEEPADAAADGEPDGTAPSATAPEPGVELLGDDSNGAGGESTRAADDAGGGGWPTRPDAPDEGHDAVPHDDTDAGVDFGGGLVPTGGDDGEGVGPSTGDDAGAGNGRDPPAPGTGAEFVTADDAGTTDADGEAELHCPNCEASWPAAGSSFRGGDICPDCRRGYVAERPAER